MKVKKVWMENLRRKNAKKNELVTVKDGLHNKKFSTIWRYCTVQKCGHASPSEDVKHILGVSNGNQGCFHDEYEFSLNYIYMMIGTIVIQISRVFVGDN